MPQLGPEWVLEPGHSQAVVHSCTRRDVLESLTNFEVIVIAAVRPWTII